MQSTGLPSLLESATYQGSASPPFPERKTKATAFW